MVNSEICVCKITITSFVLFIHNHDNEYMANTKAWYSSIYCHIMAYFKWPIYYEKAREKFGENVKHQFGKTKFGENIKILIITVELQNVWQTSLAIW